MKPIINNKLTILIIIFLCISFFLQTYFEIERFEDEITPEKNSIRINKLSEDITDNKEMITLTQLKQLIDNIYKELNNKIENNKNTSLKIIQRLDKAETDLKAAFTPTNENV
tara:strand:+ start:280 stop:615 length:336 start_codon:yes stop_codon:yes gene_type:complete